MNKRTNPWKGTGSNHTAADKLAEIESLMIRRKRGLQRINWLRHRPEPEQRAAARRLDILRAIAKDYRNQTKQKD